MRRRLMAYSELCDDLYRLIVTYVTAYVDLSMAYSDLCDDLYMLIVTYAGLCDDVYWLIQLSSY